MDDSSAWLADSAPYRVPGVGDVWAAEAARQGSTGSQRIVEVGEVVPPPEVSEALGVPTGATVVVRRRLILLDDRPVELADSYFPASIAVGTGLVSPSRIRHGAAGLLRDLGYRAARVREVVAARMPTPAESSTLGMADNEPVIVLSRLTASDEGVAMEYAVMVAPGGDRRYSYDIGVG